jgi:ABC-type transport system involved in cytochrome c biogenesis permease subunit
MFNPAFLLRFLSQPAVVFYTVLWLMVLLILGTISQRYVGLYTAQETFFYSWIFWLGPIPTPGGLPTLGLLTLCLTIKTFWASPWSWARAGTIITHLSALLLMLGGLLTFALAKEGSIALFVGESGSTFTAYHNRALVVEDAATGEVAAELDWYAIKPGAHLAIPGTPLTVTIEKMCRNCAFPERDPNKATDDRRGRARQFDIEPIPLETTDETNRAAVLFRVSGSDDDKDGVHLSTDFIDLSPWVKVSDRTFNIALRKDRHPLPFRIELLEFKKSVHPGTQIAQAYESTVLIHDQGGSWRAHISMNQPLRYRGYTIYQASFINDGKRDGSVFAVVDNVGRLFPYLASIIMSLGLAVHALQRLRVVNHARTGALIALGLMGLMTTTPSHAAATTIQWQEFGALPILDHGRLKPIDTMARSTLEILSGRDQLGDLSATEWLAGVVFNPASSTDQPVFRILNPAVRDTLDLAGRPGNRYSAREVLPAIDRTRNQWEPLLAKPRDQLALPQKQLIELIENIDLYLELGNSLAWLRPMAPISDALSQRLDLTPAPNTLYDLRQNQAALLRAMERLARKAARQNPGQTMRADEIELVTLVATMERLEQKPALMNWRVIPPLDATTDPIWHTPTALIMNPPSNRSHAQKFLTYWTTLSAAYYNGDHNGFNQSVAALASATAPHLAHHRGDMALEQLFHTYRPLDLAVWLYTLGGLTLIIMALVQTTWHRPLYRLAATLTIAALSLHMLGLGARMVITERPPVTNLYDSIIFVALVTVIMALVLEYQRRDRVMLGLAALAGAGLGFVGLRFDAEGDTMRVLVAVLDTNFWLSTHVTMITIGYGAAILTSLLAQAALVQTIRSRTHHAPLTPTTHAIALVALFFTTIGTILGGIWADQSWGRFWGWDPKENGALLIVLWLVWALHGRMSGHLPPRFFLAALAFLGVIVACAWFGVNLLGVGLHSYGFTETALHGFIVYVVVQTALIVALLAWPRKPGAQP